MSARIIDGKAIAERLRARIADQAVKLKETRGIVPRLAVVLAGQDPASTIYVGAKNNAAHQIGFDVLDLRHAETLSERALLDEVAMLNADPTVHGILVQMPLPPAISPMRIIAAIDPLKDVDGLTPINIGRLAIGESNARRGLVACTPLGALMLLKEGTTEELSGKEALVVGRSNHVGKP